jgi:hypothetical protein
VPEECKRNVDVRLDDRHERLSERQDPSIGRFSKSVFTTRKLNGADFDLRMKLISPLGKDRRSGTSVREAEQPERWVWLR